MGLKDRQEDFVRFITYLVIIVLVNLAGATLFFRIDLTSNKKYSISDVSKEVVSTLSEPLTINVFFTQNLPAPYNNTEKYLNDLLEEYSLYANDYFNYRFYDVSPETKTNQELASGYGISPVQIQIFEDDEVKFQRAYMGLVLIHGDMVEEIPTITSTDKLEYRLTTAIQKLNNKISALLRLPDKVRIKLFLSSSLSAIAPYMRLDELPALPEEIEEIVNELNTKNYGKLEFLYIDPSKESGIEKDLEKYDILSLEWPEVIEDGIKPGKGSIGLVMEYGDKVMDIPLIQAYRIPLVGTHYELINMDEMEEVINENLESLIDINEDLGYISDHGSPSLWEGVNLQGISSQDSLSNFRELVSQTYTIKEIDLSEEDIPESLNCLIIAGPRVVFSDYELFKIDQFLMRGKNLAIFLDSLIEDQTSGQLYTQSAQYIALKTGLEKLLEHYGISVNHSFVMDKNCYKQQISESYGGGQQEIYFIPFIMDRFINKDLPFIKDIKGLYVSKVSPLEIDQEVMKEKGIKAHKLFSSSEDSWEMQEWINLNPTYITPPGSDAELNSMPLAYLLEGEFTSYFADKPIPEKEEQKEDEPEDTTEEEESPVEESGPDLSNIKSEGILISKGKPGKISLIASSELLKDYMLDAEGNSTNSTLIMNLIDYLNNREGTAVMRGKDSSFNPLKEISSGLKAFVKYFNIIGLPVLVALFGILVFLRRVHRKKVIRMMFVK